MSAKLAIANPTPATGLALRKVFAMLEDNFDIAAGVYNHDCSDESIAKETGISVDAVKNYRISAFGKLKPPSEFYKIQQDVGELEKLYITLEKDLKEGLRDLRARINLLQKKFD